MTAVGLRAPVAVSLAGKAVEMVTLVLLATVVPRALGPVGYGRFSVALTIPTLGSLAMVLGGPTVMARFVPAAPPHERAALARTLGLHLARGRARQLVAIAVVAATLVAWDPVRFPPLVTGVVVLALALNVGATLGLQAGLGLGRAGPWSARYPLHNAVLVVAALLGHHLAGASGAVAAIGVAALAAAALGAAVGAPLLRQSPVPVDIPPGALRFGPFAAAGAALVQFTHRGGVVAVALLAGSGVQAGFAGLAIGLALGATYAILQTFTVSLPHLMPDAPSAETALRRLAGRLLVVVVPSAALTAVSLDAIVPLVFGDAFTGAADAFGPALALVVLAPLNALAVQVGALRLQPEVALWSGLAGAVAFVATALVAVPSLGAAGGTLPAPAGAATAALVSIRLLPGALDRGLGVVSLGGTAGVLALAVVT